MSPTKPPVDSSTKGTIEIMTTKANKSKTGQLSTQQQTKGKEPQEDSKPIETMILLTKDASANKLMPIEQKNMPIRDDEYSGDPQTQGWDQQTQVSPTEQWTLIARHKIMVHGQETKPSIAPNKAKFLQKNQQHSKQSRIKRKSIVRKKSSQVFNFKKLRKKIQQSH